MAATDFDFSQTRTQIIQRAHRIIGALAHGETLTAEQNTYGSDALNAVVKSWQSEHLFLWRLEQISSNTTASQAYFTVSTDPALIGIDRAWVVNNSNDDEEIEVISWRSYNNIPDKATTGKPQYITIAPDAVPTAYLWPTPDDTYTIKQLGICKLKDWDANSSTGDIPERFINALTYALARDLGDEYGLSIGERQHLERKAALLFDMAKKSDRDRSRKNFVTGAYD